MLTIYYLLLIVIIALKGIRLLYFFQLKEYRIDRLKDFFVYESGFTQLFSALGISSYIMVFLSLIYDNNTLFYTALIISALDLLYLNIRKARLRFKPTAKALQIFFLYLLLSIAISFYNIKLGFLLASVILLTLVLLFIPVTKLIKEIIIYRASKKIAQFPDLKIIAITGSYGKSSTKEFLSEILEPKFKILKTPKNINSDIGIAKLILEKLDSTHQIFIVEAGAYRLGEINNIVKMFPTDIAVITAISNQHLSLFGSQQNIKVAKSEIANTLKPDGKLFLNLDSNGVKEVVSNFSNKQVITYGTDPEAIFHCKNISQKKSLTFDVNNQKYQSPIFGAHNATNLTVCIAIATHFGVTPAEIQKSLQRLTNPENILAKKTGYNGSLILDDSYNANSTGFLSAIQYASEFNHNKKILITMGLAELGPDSEKEHLKIATSSARTFTHIFITKPKIYSYFSKFNSKECNIHLADDLDYTIKKLSNIIDSDTLILIQNRVNPKLYNFLLSS